MNEYVILKKLGEGSHGQAFLAENSKSKCVVKKINISYISGNALKLARDEVKLLSQLCNRHITKFLDSFEQENFLFIVMEYCSQGDLHSLIKDRNGKVFQDFHIFNMFVQLCIAVNYIHKNHIIHRDIKSENIFITKQGFIKLGDFGIAKQLDTTADLACTFIGTPYYLSPEMCENKPYSYKSDIWAVGCILYLLISLKHAFLSSNIKSLMVKIINCSYKPLPVYCNNSFKVIIDSIFQRNQHLRPSITKILLFSSLKKYVQKFMNIEELKELENLSSNESARNTDHFQSIRNRLGISNPMSKYRQVNKVKVNTTRNVINRQSKPNIKTWRIKQDAVEGKTNMIEYTNSFCKKRFSKQFQKNISTRNAPLECQARNINGLRRKFKPNLNIKIHKEQPYTKRNILVSKLCNEIECANACHVNEILSKIKDKKYLVEDPIDKILSIFPKRSALSCKFDSYNWFNQTYIISRKTTLSKQTSDVIESLTRGEFHKQNNKKLVFINRKSWPENPSKSIINYLESMPLLEAQSINYYMTDFMKFHVSKSLTLSLIHQKTKAQFFSTCCPTLNNCSNTVNLNTNIISQNFNSVTSPTFTCVISKENEMDSSKEKLNNFEVVSWNNSTASFICNRKDRTRTRFSKLLKCLQINQVNSLVESDKFFISKFIVIDLDQFYMFKSQFFLNKFTNQRVDSLRSKPLSLKNKNNKNYFKFLVELQPVFATNVLNTTFSNSYLKNEKLRKYFNLKQQIDKTASMLSNFASSQIKLFDMFPFFWKYSSQNPLLKVCSLKMYQKSENKPFKIFCNTDYNTCPLFSLLFRVDSQHYFYEYSNSINLCNFKFNKVPFLFGQFYFNCVDFSNINGWIEEQKEILEELIGVKLFIQVYHYLESIYMKGRLENKNCFLRNHFGRVKELIHSKEIIFLLLCHEDFRSIFMNCSLSYSAFLIEIILFLIVLESCFY